MSFVEESSIVTMLAIVAREHAKPIYNVVGLKPTLEYSS